MLAAGLVLAFMIPFIAAVMRDVFEIVPPILRESAYGLGCTTWEVVRHVVLPYTQKGVVGGVMLGLGRAWANHGRHLRDRQLLQASTSLFRPRHLDRLHLANGSARRPTCTCRRCSGSASCCS